MNKQVSLWKSTATSFSLLLGLCLLDTSSAHAHDYYAAEQVPWDEDDHHHHQHRHRGRFMLALDLDYSASFSNDLIEQGGGGGLRLGTEVDLFLVTLIPELTLNYHSFGADARDNAQLISGKVGGRIRFLKIVEPGIFSHIGIGNLSGDDRFSHTGPAFDVGVTVDLTIIPLIDIGLHASWNRIFGGYDSGVSYGITGAHVALVL